MNGAYPPTDTHHFSMLYDVRRLLLILCSSLVVEVRTWTTLAALRTWTTLTALRTWTTLTLYITLWLLHQYTMRELVLTSLRINLHQLHLDLVAFLDASLFNCLKTLPVDLRDMEQTILTWQNLYEATVRHD